MLYTEKVEANLQKQEIPQTMRSDFAEFWQDNINRLREIPIRVAREKLDTRYENSEYQ